MIGVFKSSSCLMTSSRPGCGLLGSSDGRVADLGVLRAGRLGLGDLGVMMVGVGGTCFLDSVTRA